ncbi:hypothetical protein NMY22_g6135 [Coprinellus aureogranulatus]|nr:hypothetical protein NMY22_g6135 [Coprinellus aureogranulatus]
MSSSNPALSSSPGTIRTQDDTIDPHMSSQQCTQNFIGAVKDEWQLFSDRACDYTIGEPIGFGASSIVYTAVWKPVDDPNAKPIPCALKVLDLDSLPPRSLSLLQRETTLMSLSKHPNVLRVRGSWMEGHKLYIALRLMNKGSAADVMRYGWPGGMEEEVVKCILRQALKGLKFVDVSHSSSPVSDKRPLSYLHVNGFIHRDIKAANLLIDDDGTVLLGDLGVAADLSEDPHHHHSSSSSASKGSKVTATAALAQPGRVYTTSTTSKPEPSRPVIGKRKSFVGTPCWMAPELISGKQYDASADIWSFGITAIELSQGHPPRFRESPQKVLLRTLQEDPPSLDRKGGAFKYSQAFKEMVDSCLVKDPSKRPTAEQLLNTPLFRSAKKKSNLVNAILKDLPPLVQRQERRVLPNPASPNSVDSWDFSTTVNSPAGSVFRHITLQRLVAEEEEGVLPPDQWQRKSQRHRFHDPSTSVEHSEFDYGTEDEEEEEDDDKRSTEASSTTASDTRSLADSSSGSPDGGVSTAPSSYVPSSPIAIKGREHLAVAVDEGKGNSTSSSAPDEHPLSQSLPSPHETVISRSGKRLPSHETAPALADMFTPLAEPLTKIQSAASESDFRSKDSTKRTRLWKKVTSTLKPSKSGGGSSEKSKLGELISSASRNTIGKVTRGSSSVGPDDATTLATTHLYFDIFTT